MPTLFRFILGSLTAITLIVGGVALFSAEREPVTRERAPQGERSVAGAWVRLTSPEASHVGSFGIELPGRADGWVVGEKIIPPDEAGPFRYQISFDAPPQKTVTISVFLHDPNIRAYLLRPTQRRLDAARVVPSFDEETESVQQTLLANTPAAGEPDGLTAIVETEDHLYEVVMSGLDATDLLFVAEIRIAGRPIRLPPNPFRPVTNAQGPCCGVVDKHVNTYACCGTLGNCTWYCETRTLGDNNFKFNGSGRDAYTWITKAGVYNTKTNSIGGTIPQKGAIIVFVRGINAKKDDPGSGHVAYVESVNADGSVSVTEQNFCSSTCTPAKTYSVDSLRTYLAGYIYPTPSRPTPTPKPIAGTKGAVTHVEDHNRSNVYHFNTEGPGFKSAINGGERTWGSGGSGTGYFHWMLSGTEGNSGKWAIRIDTSGLYKIEAFVPQTSMTLATRARYKVAMNGPIVYSASVNQSASKGAYVQIRNPNRADGYWNFPAAADGNGVRLEDNYGGNNPEAGVTIIMDVLRFTRM